MEPITREEIYLHKIIDKLKNGGGSNSDAIKPINLQDKTITENGTYSADDGYDGIGTVVVEVSGSGGSSATVSTKDIMFYDYDGTPLYSYTLDELKGLSELPTLPSHDGLVCQGWNWTLEDLKAQNTPMNVGATYTTDDGSTRIYITIASKGRMDFPLRFNQSKDNGVVIDWGDGSDTETINGTGIVNPNHTYGDTGDYVIRLMPLEGCDLALGGESSYNIVARNTGNNMAYANMITRVEFGNGITSIGGYAFYNCKSLRNVTIPNSVTRIGGLAFRLCASLTSITIPSGVTSIDGNLFNGCISLKSVTIPKGVKSFGNSSFSDCYSLTSITIPDSVTTINGSFSECYSLTSITIPDSVTSIGTHTFSGCYSLTSVIIHGEVTYIGDNTFYNCKSLRNVTIPNSVTSIGQSAFYYCSSLTSITIPDSVTSIGQKAFYYCSSLNSITISKGVTGLDTYVFSDCYSLTSITIPDSVTSIGQYVFKNCGALKYYDFTQYTTVPTLSSTTAFNDNASDFEIRVPSAIYDEWIAATNWSTHASKIVAA